MTMPFSLIKVPQTFYVMQVRFQPHKIIISCQYVYVSEIISMNCVKEEAIQFYSNPFYLESFLCRAQLFVQSPIKLILDLA